MNLEQRRRDLMAADAELYQYIRRREQAAVMDAAGDRVSGLTDCHTAANLLWAQSAELRVLAAQANEASGPVVRG